MTCDSCPLSLKSLELQLEVSALRLREAFLLRHISILQSENGNLKGENGKLKELASDCREHLRNPWNLHRNDLVIETINHQIGEQMI